MVHAHSARRACEPSNNKQAEKPKGNSMQTLSVAPFDSPSLFPLAQALYLPLRLWLWTSASSFSLVLNRIHRMPPSSTRSFFLLSKVLSLLTLAAMLVCFWQLNVAAAKELDLCLGDGVCE